MGRSAVGTRRSTAGTNQRKRRHNGTGRVQRPARDYAEKGVKHGELPAGPAERCDGYLLQPGERLIEYPGIPAVRGGRRLRCRADGGAGDMLLAPDPMTFKILPWAPDTAWIIADMYLKDQTRMPTTRQIPIW